MSGRAALLAIALALGSAEAKTPRGRLLDLSADILEPGESQIGLMFGYYGRGVAPHLQLSAHLAPYLITMVNGSAKIQWLARPELRASLEVGVYWQILELPGFGAPRWVPVEARFTLPTVANVELNLAGRYQWLIGSSASGASLHGHGLRAEVDLVWYGPKAAFFLQGRFPLLTNSTMLVSTTVGPVTYTSLTLDDVAAWSVVLGGDLPFLYSAHARLGLGYRNRPGILLVDSLGYLIVQADLYWR